MFDTYQICPYTGLRSFSEEESLYFKGREEDIDQATGQLQKNKFLMLTGASGDGKSSLVYAGIIPNARAGFLKSKYTNWCVANFRPERTPFLNLCDSLAKQLNITNASTVEAELNHGFSALVDLYKNSSRYIDIHSSTWLLASDKDKNVMKRKAANLVILVDQFEEFFTNPENYQHGAPSKDANLVLNLLLETARIALDEDIPIYVIFTMRSDYIGQCAAFRGLPEYIGFSQFFVPRLNRSQLQQVIEEPAVLSGNRIARRLTERLIHDLTEGVDQLPILQHALKQIWIAADNGNEEMDLIHYAMVGGMSVQDLPQEQVEKFGSWFSSLAPEIKACYHAPSLQNVLDTHTNKLYERAAGYYHDKTGQSIPGEEAKNIIRTAFSCLTKIDQGRAVRNRMTLQEITHILGKPEYGTIAVGSLLNIFREPGNTFIHPFISEENHETAILHPDQVLDITHESLIRNWQYLGRWAREEFDSYSISLDFEKQLDRWVNSGKSATFLLSIGPLTYFESWYNKARPNAWWIARYLPEETKKENRLESANEILQNSREFIRKSSAKHVITRTIMRYGPKRIALILGILALLTLSSFVIRDHFKKQPEAVLNSLHRQALTLAVSPKVILVSKSAMIAEDLKSGGTTLNEVLHSIQDPVEKISTINGVAALLIFQGNDQPADEIHQALFLTDSLLENIAIPENDPVRLSDILKEINLYRVALELAYYYSPNNQIAQWRKRNALLSAHWVTEIMTKQPAGFHDMENFTVALENAINYQAFTSDELNQIIKQLSPLENGLPSDWLKSNFQKDKILVRGEGRENYGFKFNGLYQELAYLYAATGKTGKVLQCMDTLLASSENNFQSDYATGGDNAMNIAAVFLLNDKTDSLDSFVGGYSSRKKTTVPDFYMHILGRTLHSFEATANLRLYPYMGETQNLNLKFFNRKNLSLICNRYREAVEHTIQLADEKNFKLALSYKDEGILKSLNKEKPEQNELTTDQFFDKALSYYHQVGAKYLQESTPMFDNGLDTKTKSRNYLFIYPDLRLDFHPTEPRTYFYFFFSDAFMRYILRNHLMDSFYPGAEELDEITQWIEDYNTLNINLTAFTTQKLNYSFLKDLEHQLAKKTSSGNIDLNWLYLYLGKDAQDSAGTDEMLGYYNKIDPSSIFNLFRTKEFFGFVRDQSFRMISYAVEGYAKAGRLPDAIRLTHMFKNPVNRSTLYSYAAVQLLREKADPKLAAQLIDSANIEMSRKENMTNEQPNRRTVAYALMMQDPSANQTKAYTIIRNLPAKLAAIQEICRSQAFHGNLYQAEENIPDFISPSDQADFINNILMGYSEGNEHPGIQWIRFSNQYLHLVNSNLIYIDENN